MTTTHLDSFFIDVIKCPSCGKDHIGIKTFASDTAGVERYFACPTTLEKVYVTDVDGKTAKKAKSSK